MTTGEKRLNALSIYNFRLYMGMRLPVTLAIQIQSVAIGWQVYAMTSDPMALGLVGLAQFLPVFGLTLIAGHVTDRYNRRVILVLTLALQLLSAVLLLGLTAAGIRNVWPVYGVLFLFGVARAFSGPASQALLPNLVPVEYLNSALAWNASAFQGMTILGPALGGVIYAVSPNAAYETAIVFLIVSTLATLAITIKPRELKPLDMSWEAVFAGVKFIRSRSDILGALSLDLFAVLFGGATALLPIYARDILNVGPVGLGVLRSAPAVGAVLVGLVLAQRSLGRHTGWTMFACVALFGLSTVVFGLTANLYVSLAALTVMGAVDMVSVFIRHNLVQRATPDAMRGRVSAVNSFFIGTSNELGEMESGATASWFGTVEAVVIGGVATVLVCALWLWRFPRLRELDRLEDIRVE
jgi:MFS family permease